MMSAMQLDAQPAGGLHRSEPEGIVALGIACVLASWSCLGLEMRAIIDILRRAPRTVLSAEKRTPRRAEVRAAVPGGGAAPECAGRAAEALFSAGGVLARQQKWQVLGDRPERTQKWRATTIWATYP